MANRGGRLFLTGVGICVGTMLGRSVPSGWIGRKTADGEKSEDNKHYYIIQKIQQQTLQQSYNIKENCEIFTALILQDIMHNVICIMYSILNQIKLNEQNEHCFV